MAGRAGGLTAPNVDPGAAWRRLSRRRDVREARRVARDLGIEIRAVGGAVRDAFFGLPGGDLDLSVAPRDAERVTFGIAKRLSGRALRIGATERRIHRVVWKGGEVDVWERTSTLAEDRDRRDFTINALAFDLPEGGFDAPAGALLDLARRRLRPPRAGVFLEDPIRVLRAARLLARFDGFRLERAALPEILAAAARLSLPARERRLTELDLLLSEPAAKAALALGRLLSWGALGVLFPALDRRVLRRGIHALESARAAAVPLARVLLVHAGGASKGKVALESLGIPRRDLALASRLLAVPLRRRKTSVAPRDVVLLARLVAPFLREAVVYLKAVGDSGTRLLAEALDRRLTAAGERRLLSPTRPIGAEEVAAALSLAPGPALGAALAELDTALAAGEIRGRRAALAHLEKWRASQR